MFYIQKKQTWRDNWNDMIRYVFFKDEKLCQLMCIPANCTITQFTDKYFIQSQSGSQILVNEPVRILYYDSQGSDSRNKNVLNRYKQFDIYIKQTHLHNADKDRLKNRYNLIEQRLKYLMLNFSIQHGLTFRFYNSFNLWTKTDGYRRYHVVFSYNTTV